MEINWLEWLGYLASLIVLISLLMSSIIKLRWINLVGSTLFSIYGFLIGALPVGVMNLGIACINIYYLLRIYTSKDSFRILPVEGNTQYFSYFLDYYRGAINKYTDASRIQVQPSGVSFFILRNLVPAGVLIGSKYDDNTLNVELDFVIPEYRDFKIGHYIYHSRKDFFLENGYSRLISFPSNEEQMAYLKKMGFHESLENGNKFFVKTIV